jgi:hypothetical protein
MNFTTREVLFDSFFEEEATNIPYPELPHSGSNVIKISVKKFN